MRKRCNVRLNGKTVFITGGTGGIGVPLVQILRKAGAVVSVYDRRIDGDLVLNIESISAKLAEAVPDILINMAGYNDFNYCEDQDMQAIIDLNLMVPLRLIQAVLPAMKKRNSGQIINIGSMTGLIPLPHLTGYVTAKAGLKAFTDSLRRELGGTGISVTHIVPRAVKTGMNAGLRAEINTRTNVTYDDPRIVAQRIFKAIENKEREVRFGFPERLYAFINAVFPTIIDAGLNKNRLIGEELLNSTQLPKETSREKTTLSSLRSAG